MERDTSPGGLVVPAATMEQDIAAISAILRRRGPTHTRKLRDLLEALTESREKRQSDR